MGMPFQFTHPGKGATLSRRIVSYQPGFQFTHPGKGATSAPVSIRLAIQVSIHAPWEGCDGVSCAWCSLLSVVSIHAPWEGCDSHRVSPFTTPKRFQFTHPGKGATGGPTTPAFRYRRFNSRTLGRVRLSTRSIRAMFAIVSIHAPWEGCDVGVAESVKSILCFNSRTLGRVRLVI